MALLPNLFRDTDIPLTLGAKVVPVIVVQLTPEEMFEKKDHSLGGYAALVDQCAAALREGMLGRCDGQVTFSSKDTKVLSEHHQVYATFGLEENLAKLNRLRKDELLARLTSLIHRAEDKGFAPARDMMNAPECFTNMQIRLGCEHWEKRLDAVTLGDKLKKIKHLEYLVKMARIHDIPAKCSEIVLKEQNTRSIRDIEERCEFWEQLFDKKNINFYAEF